jgi:hypothetical protein
VAFGWILFYLILMGGGTGLFGNSRLGRAKFPFRAGTGIGSQEFDLARWFRGGMAVAEGKWRKFPIQRE